MILISQALPAVYTMSFMKVKTFTNRICHMLFTELEKWFLEEPFGVVATLQGFFPMAS